MTTFADSEALCREAAQRVAVHMSQGKQAELDPATIRAWAELIFELLERCMELRRQASGVETAARSPGTFDRLRVRAAARRKLGWREFKERGEQLVEALFAAAAEARPGEIAQLAETISQEVDR